MGPIRLLLGEKWTGPRERACLNCQPWLFLVLGLVSLSCRRSTVPSARPFRAALYYDLSTLDPHVEATVSNSLLYNVYEALVAVDGDLQIRPGLAESWTTPDELTWHLRLRQGVRFHSGKLLGAADVVYSLERILRDPALEAGYYLVDVAGARVLDERTVEVRTRYASPILLNRLSFVPIVPDGAPKGSLAVAADGTGPYRVASWQKGSRLDLVRHEAYWGKAPAIREATFRFNQDPREITRGLLAGDYQLATLGALEAAPEITSSASLAVLRTDSLYVKYLAFDLARDETPFCRVRPNPFKDKRVRQAIHLALDRVRLVAGYPGATPATQLVPRFVLGFAPDITVPVSDRARARELMREAGLGNGLAATLHTRGPLANAAAAVREQLATVGIALEIRVLSDPEYWRAVDRSELTLWMGRWGCTTIDAGELFENAMHSLDRPHRLGLYNRGGPRNPFLDRAIEESRVVPGRAERRDVLQSLMRSVMDELYWVPLYSDREGYALDRAFSWRPRYSVRIAEVEPAGP